MGTNKLPFADRAAGGRALAPLVAEVVNGLADEAAAGAPDGEAAHGTTGALAGVACVVLALPRGGVPVAAEVAAALGAPLDVLVVRKLGMPGQPELAFGAVASGPDPRRPVQVRNDAVLRRTGLDLRELDTVVEREVAELHRRERAYRGDRPVAEVAGRVAVIVDDGLATGASAHAALLAVRAGGPAAVVLAVPVAPRSTLVQLDGIADHVVCAASPRRFTAVGRHYTDFHQVTDAEVRAALGS